MLSGILKPGKATVRLHCTLRYIRNYIGPSWVFSADNYSVFTTLEIFSDLCVCFIMNAIIFFSVNGFETNKFYGPYTLWVWLILSRPLHSAQTFRLTKATEISICRQFLGQLGGKTKKIEGLHAHTHTTHPCGHLGYFKTIIGTLCSSLQNNILSKNNGRVVPMRSHVAFFADAVTANNCHTGVSLSSPASLAFYKFMQLLEELTHFMFVWSSAWFVLWARTLYPTK